MLLKRKRSTTALSSPSSSDTSTNTVQSFYPHTKPLPSPLPDLKPTLTSSDLNARTRKRHRDNRPEASAIHGACNSSSASPPPCWLGAVIKMSALADVCRVAASTIQRLYDAQRAANNSLLPAEELQQQQQPAAQQQQPTTTQKSTLHSFWHISQPPPLPVAQAQQQQGFCSDGPRCEDCDGGLKGEDAMEVDEVAGEDKACTSCRRRVCDGCTAWGSERVCQGCAGGRGW